MELHRRKAQALEEFEEWSGKYDRSILNLLIFQRSHRIILQKLRKKAGKNTSTFRILDIGCGTGTFLASCLGAGLCCKKASLAISYWPFLRKEVHRRLNKKNTD